jgi:hypothetical protein
MKKNPRRTTRRRGLGRLTYKAVLLIRHPALRDDILRPPAVGETAWKYSKKRSGFCQMISNRRFIHPIITFTY